jgi:hypothetical protein
MSEYEPKVGFYSSEVQRMANSLPQWMKLRRERDSKGQSFLTPAGATLEHINDQLEEFLRNRFPELTNLDEPDQLRKIQLPYEIQFKDPKYIENYLLNSSFELWTSQDRLPDYWRSTGVGTVNVGTGILGANAIQLRPDASNYVDLYQEVDQLIRAGVAWTFYTWYVSTATGLTPPATGFGLEIIGTHHDATTETLRVSFDADTSGHPRRAMIQGSFTQDVMRIRFRAVSTNSVGFPITTPVYVDIAMAAPGDTSLDWKPNPFDNYPYINFYDRLMPVAVENPRRIQFVEKFEDFWGKSVPTRASSPLSRIVGASQDPAPTPGTDGVTIYSTTGRSYDVDYFGDRWKFAWQLIRDVSNNPRIRALGTEAGDILGPFDIGFRNWRNWIEDGATWYPEAMTFFHGYLFVILYKSTVQAAGNRHFLAIVDPKTLWPRPSYLECLAMIELDLSDELTITRAEIRRSDQQWLYLGDGQTEWAFPLHYDYFMIDDARKALYLREDYGTVVPQLMFQGRDDELSLQPREG